MSDKNEVAIRLAHAHYRIEPSVSQIFRVTAGDAVEAQPDEPIKLLEVNAATIPSGIAPLYFEPLPHGGIDYPTVIIEVTPEEYEQLRAGRLKLPNAWRIDSLLPRPGEVGSPI
jgi:hypothetical protein